MSGPGDEDDGEWEGGPSTSRGTRGPYKKKNRSTSTPGGPLTEARIATMEIIKQGDYLLKGRTKTQYWAEKSVKIIFQVRKSKIPVTTTKAESFNLWISIYCRDQ